MMKGAVENGEVLLFYLNLKEQPGAERWREGETEIPENVYMKVQRYLLCLLQRKTEKERKRDFERL